jgi:hypothetical protein
MFLWPWNNSVDPTAAASVPPGKTRPASNSDPLPKPSDRNQTVSNDLDPSIAAVTATVFKERSLDRAQPRVEDDLEMYGAENSKLGGLEDAKPASIQLPLLTTEAPSQSLSRVGARDPVPLKLLELQLSRSPSGLERRTTISGSESHRSPNHLPSGGTLYRQHNRTMSSTMRKLSDMLGTLLRTQLKVQEARTSLKNYRHNVADLDGQFTRKLQMILATGPNEEVASLLELGENLVASRDEMFPKEDDYDILEDQLIRDEFELQEAITSLVPRLEASPDAFLDGQQSFFPDNVDEGLAPISSTEGEFQRPELADYLSCLGDATLAQERLDGLRRERAHLVEEERIRSRYGLGLSEESRDFLNNFDTRHEEYQRQVATAQLDLGRIKGILALSGLNDMDHYSSNVFDDQTSAGAPAIPSAYIESAGSFLILDDETSGSVSPSRPSSPRDRIQDMQNPRLDPLLLADDDTSTVFPVTNYGEKGTIDTDTYIRDWLLNRLRRSSLEVLRFRSNEQLQPHNLVESQPRDVIVHWISQEERPNPASSRRKGRPSSTSAFPIIEVERPVTRTVRSDSVVHTVDALASRLHRTGPSLRMSDVVRENVSGYANFLAQSGRLGRGAFH